MYIFKKVSDLQKWIDDERSVGNIIGFVPTMGALHQGHLSLIQKAHKNCDRVVCSIFVNPTQFNDPADLAKYPRTFSADVEALSSVETGSLLMPSVEEVYPPGLDTTLNLDFGELDEVMEGAFRPGHFVGMAQVVWRLLDIVKPDFLFMGQKDFQQLTIVRSMLRQMNSEIKLVMCPIVREEDGLAMSSRNVRLDTEQRANVPRIHQVLQAVEGKVLEETPEKCCTWAMEELGKVPGFRPEYFSIVDGVTLQPISSFEDSEFVVACTAIWVGKVRLIDNFILKNEHS